MVKTLTSKMGIHTTTNHQTYELLANELIDHFPARVARRLNNTKTRKVKHIAQEDKDWYTSWERQREVRSETWERKPKGF